MNKYNFLKSIGLTNELISSSEMSDRPLDTIVSTYCSHTSCIGQLTRKLGVKVGEGSEALKCCPNCKSDKFLAFKSVRVRKPPNGL